MPTPAATPNQSAPAVAQNVRRGPNMTVQERDVAIGMLQAGATVREVAETFGRSRSTIHRLYQKFHHTSTTRDKPRAGRPSILSDHQKKILYRAARKTPKILYEDLAKVATTMELDGTPSKAPSHSTLYRVLRRRKLVKFRCKKRPKLTPQRARKRYNFACQYRSFPWHRRTVKFSDECSVQKGSGGQQE